MGHTWSESFRAMLSRPVITMLFLGFSAGVPILLVFSTLSFWLREAEVSRSAIGFFSWAGLAYGFKYVWAPLVDRLPLPVLTARLGRRRGWLLLSQSAIIVALLLMALNDPVVNLPLTAVFAVMLGFSSATQDIVVDAYRIEAAEEEIQGLMSSAYIGGYRVGMIVAGAGALEVAGLFDPDEATYQYQPWMMAYLAMAAAMGVGVLTTLLIHEPERKTAETVHTTRDHLRFLGVFAAAALVFGLAFAWSGDLAEGAPLALLAEDWGLGPGLAAFILETLRLLLAVVVAGLAALVLVRAGAVNGAMVRESYVDPFMDFFGRYGRIALLILALIALYRIADVVMGVMANVFYKDLGFAKEEVARVSKFFGVGVSIAGSFLGGVLIVRYGVMKILFLGALLAAATNVLFALMAGVGPSIPWLIAVICADNLAGGMAAAAFVAYLSSLTSVRFTATQYALFSSIMLLFPKLLAGYSGVVVDQMGYAPFFIGTALLGLPVLVLIVLAARLTPVQSKEASR